MTAILKCIVTPFAAAIVALLIASCGEVLWGFLALANLRFHAELPWAPAIMAVFLAILLPYLAGFGPPAGTRAQRRELLRWNAIPLKTFFWAVLAGTLAIAALSAAWIALSDLIYIPPGITPSMKGVPRATAISFLITASLVAPLSEEAAFRGYAQGLLERAWGRGLAAIVGSSILFALWHVTQGLSLPKLGLYFSAGLILGAIAYVTNSLYAAMVVHSVADIIGFLLLWPHDAPHPLIIAGGHDPFFVPAAAAVAIFAPLVFMAFRRLAKSTPPRCGAAHISAAA